MKRLNSVVTTIRIRIDQIQKINDSEMNLSEFVREKLDEEFETTETLAEKESELLSELETIKNRKEIIKNKGKKDISEEKYLKQMKEHSRMYGIEDALANYNLKFGKKIKMDKFRELIDDR